MFLEPGGGDESQVPRYTLENPTLTGWLVKKLISLSTPLETLDDIDPGSGMIKRVWSLIHTDIILYKWYIWCLLLKTLSQQFKSY